MNRVLRGTAMILLLLAASAVALACWLGVVQQGTPRAASPSGHADPTTPPRPRAGGVKIRIGKKLDDRGKFERFLELTEEELHKSVLCLGRTGGGKSRWCNNLAHECFVNGISGLVLDPDGDLCEDLLARIARDVVETGNKRLLKKVHYLELSPFTSWRYDPFAFRLFKPVHPELLPFVRVVWQHCKVAAVGQILLRNQGEGSFEGMPRLQRVLGDVLQVVSTEFEGGRLSLGEAGFVLDFGHKLNPRLWAKVENKLPGEVAADFRLLRSLKNVEAMRKETESTVNRLRSMFGPVLKSIFGDPGKTSFNLFDAVQRGHLVLVNLRPSQFVSENQATAVGRMFLYDHIETTTATPREIRRDSIVLADEASRLLTPDTGPALRRGRKYKRGLVLASQELSSFRQGDLDLRDVVTSQPHTVATFAQRLPDDLAFLARLMFTGKLSFEELLNEVERRGETRFIPILERSWGVNSNDNWSHGGSAAEGETRTEGQTKSLAESLGWSQNQGDMIGTSEGDTTNHSESVKFGWEFGHGPSDRQVADGGTRSRSSQRQNSLTNGTSGNETKTTADTQSKARQKTRTRTGSVGGADGSSQNWSLRYAQIQETLRERVATGQLKCSVADQLEEFAQRIFLLRPRHAYVLVGNEVHYMEAIDVPDPFPSALSLVKAVAWVQRELRKVHPYLFTPDLTPEEEGRRLEALFGVGQDEPAEPVADKENPIA